MCSTWRTESRKGPSGGDILKDRGLWVTGQRKVLRRCWSEKASAGRDVRVWVKSGREGKGKLKGRGHEMPYRSQPNQENIRSISRTHVN